MDEEQAARIAKLKAETELVELQIEAKRRNEQGEDAARVATLKAGTELVELELAAKRREEQSERLRSGRWSEIYWFFPNSAIFELCDPPGCVKVKLIGTTPVCPRPTTNGMDCRGNMLSSPASTKI